MSISNRMEKLEDVLWIRHWPHIGDDVRRCATCGLSDAFSALDNPRFIIRTGPAPEGKPCPACGRRAIAFTLDISTAGSEAMQ